jgi:hypothetical protein
MYLGFLRLRAIPCPRCRTLVRLDRRGSCAFWGTLVVAAILGATAGMNDAGALGILILGAGLTGAVSAAIGVGRLRVSPENQRP